MSVNRCWLFGLITNDQNPLFLITLINYLLLLDHADFLIFIGIKISIIEELLVAVIDNFSAFDIRLVVAIFKILSLKPFLLIGRVLRPDLAGIVLVFLDNDRLGNVFALVLTEVSHFLHLVEDKDV